MEFIRRFHTPVKCAHCEFTFTNSRALNQHMDSEHDPEKIAKEKTNMSNDDALVVKTDLIEENDIKTTPEEAIQVKYELNTVQNIKKAKSNLIRSTQLTRMNIDDMNTKFEVHPGIYLEIKDKAKNIRQGMEFEDLELGIKVKVTRTRRSITKKNNDIPENAIWYDITDGRTGVTTKCVEKLYHTTQTIHLQGGEKIGKITTTSILADYLEKECMEIIETEKEKIEQNTKMLADIDIKKFQESKKPKVAKKPDLKCTCSLCPYTSQFLYQMKIHMYGYHQNKDIKSIKKSCVKSLSYGAVKKDEAVKRLRIAKTPDQSKENTGDKDEYIQHFITPKTSPEPSPAKKKVKENPLISGDIQTAAQEVNVSTKETDIKKKENESQKEGNESEKKENESGNNEVANEVGLLIQNLQDDIKVKDSRIKFIESEKQTLEIKVKSMRTEIGTEKESTQKVEREKELLHIEYVKCCKSNKELAKEMDKVKSDYKECAQQLNFAQRKSEELAETLRITEAVMQAQEEEEEDDGDNNEEGVDDEDFLKDEDHPGKLWQVMQEEFNCKKCDQKIMGNKSFREHMQKHIKDQKEVLPCYYCDYRTVSENEFLNHISSVHGAGHICLTCNNAFRTQEEMIKHVVATHPKSKKKVHEKCVTCGEEFTKVEKLTEHILRNHTMLKANGQSNMAGQQLVKIWPLQESIRYIDSIKCYDCQNTFGSKDQLMNHKREKHFKKKLCSFYHKHGNCRYGDQCINIHETNNHMNADYRQTQSYQQSRIKCRNGPNCMYRDQNRSNFSHAESVQNVSNVEQSSGNTSVFNMEKLLESLGARMERIEQSVPNLKSLKDFPSVEEARAKQKTS